MNKRIVIGAAGGCVVAACIAAIAKKNESGAKPTIWPAVSICSMKIRYSEMVTSATAIQQLRPLGTESPGRPDQIGLAR